MVCVSNRITAAHLAIPSCNPLLPKGTPSSLRKANSAGTAQEHHLNPKGKHRYRGKTTQIRAAPLPFHTLSLRGSTIKAIPFMTDKLTITDPRTIEQVLELEQFPLLEGRDRDYIISRAIEKYYFRKQSQLIYKQSKWFRMKAMLRAQGYSCAYCTRPLTRKNATTDHRVPLVAGGDMNSMENQVAVCSWCNHEKGDMEEGDFLLYLKSKQTWNETHPDDKRKDEHDAALHEQAIRSCGTQEVPNLGGTEE